MKKYALFGIILLGLTIQATAHEHKPPHNGTLVVFGEEFAHLEFVLDPSTGKLTAYALDGEAEQAVRMAQKEIELKVRPPGTNESIVKLTAVGSDLTGETPGDTSQFEGQSELLKNAKEFDAIISAVTLKGQEFKDVKFNFPKGNE
jgi:hypothetical protein